MAPRPPKAALKSEVTSAEKESCLGRERRHGATHAREGKRIWGRVHFTDATTAHIHTHGHTGGKTRKFSNRGTNIPEQAEDSLPHSHVPLWATRQRLPLQASD